MMFPVFSNSALFLPVLVGLISILFSAPPIHAQEGQPQLIKDIHTGTVGASIRRVVDYGDGLYIIADDPTEDSQRPQSFHLWKYEFETSELAFLQSVCYEAPTTARIHTGGEKSGGEEPQLYFLCNQSLWLYDDQLGEARLITQPLTAEPDLLAGLVPQRILSTPDGLMIIIQSDQGLNIWMSDGTADGTTLIKQIPATVDGLYSLSLAAIYVNQYAVVGDTHYFTAFDAEHGIELWKSDGTTAGTQLVRDINPESTSILLYNVPYNFVAMNGILYFGATDGSSGYELWRSDGTADGTYMVMDINQGADDAFSGPPIWGGINRPITLHSADNALFFLADDGTNGRRLWTSDGTEAGTKMVTGPSPDEPNADAPYSNLTAVGDRLAFLYADQLWVTNISDVKGEAGSEAESGTGATLLFDPASMGTGSVEQLRASGNNLFFVTEDDEHGQELWVSDLSSGLSSEGPQVVKDIKPGPLGSEPSPLAVLNEKLYFMADDRIHGNELWASDGTAEGTQLVADMGQNAEGSDPHSFTLANDRLFFVATDSATDRDLWMSDGSTQGTAVVKGEAPNRDSLDPRFLTNVNGTLFFSATDSDHGRELWKSDGTPEGTKMVVDLTPGTDGTNFSSFTEHENSLLFAQRYTGDNSSGIWRSDGSAAGTAQVTRLFPQSPIISWEAHIYFCAYGPINDSGSRELLLWQSSGEAGAVDTQLPIPGACDAIQTQRYHATADALYLLTSTEGGYQFWQISDQAGDAVLVADVDGVEPCSDLFTNVDGTFYFSATVQRSGCELWKSDDTLQSATLVRNIGPDPAAYQGSTSSNPNQLAVVGGQLYFMALEGSNGWGLWHSDGTEEGTVRLTLIESENDSPPRLLGIQEDTIYLRDDRNQLFRVDRTNGWRAKVTGSAAGGHGLFGGKLYYSGAASDEGAELWAIGPAEISQSYLPLHLGPAHFR